MLSQPVLKLQPGFVKIILMMNGLHHTPVQFLNPRVIEIGKVFTALNSYRIKLMDGMINRPKVMGLDVKGKLILLHAALN